MRLETLAVSKLMERMVNNGGKLGVLLFAKITDALMKGGIHK